MPRHARAGEVARGDRATVEGGHDALAVGGDVIDAQLRWQHVVLRRAGRRHHLERRRVHAIRPRRQERQLAAALAAVLQKRRGVLKAVTRDVAREDAARRDRPAVGGDQKRDVARLHDQHGHAHDVIAPAPDREVPARTEHARLVTGLAVQRDDVPGGQLRAVPLDEQPGLVRTDDAESEPRHPQHRDGDRRDERPLLERQQAQQPHGVSSRRATRPAHRRDQRISRATGQERDLVGRPQ